MYQLSGREDVRSREGITPYNINHLKTKRRLLYLKTQSVPRC